jgi:hypothetical protein
MPQTTWCRLHSSRRSLIVSQITRSFIVSLGTRLIHHRILDLTTDSNAWIPPTKRTNDRMMADRLGSRLRGLGSAKMGLFACIMTGSLADGTAGEPRSKVFFRMLNSECAS